MDWVALLGGGLAGAAIGGLAVRSHLAPEVAALRARLDASAKGEAEKLAVLQDAQQKLSQQFQALSAEALQRNNQAFLDLAGSTLASRQQAVADLVRPLKDSLEKLEQRRTEAYVGLLEQVKALSLSQNQLQREASNLVRALRQPNARGRWGEIQLRRVVEMAGMVAHCDFCEQFTMNTVDGKLRPDLIVHLPNQRQIVVDSKVSLAAYLDALETTDDAVRTLKLKEHALQVRQHLRRLSEKSYWQGLAESPEFVVAFLPGETFFGAALEHDPELIEFGVERQVILATPTTLIALLKSVAYGWRQEKVARDAAEIGKLGAQLHERLAVLAEHFEALRGGLNHAVEAYNRTVGSLESRVLVSARRLRELHVQADREIPEVQPVEALTRQLQSGAGR